MIPDLKRLPPDQQPISNGLGDSLSVAVDTNNDDLTPSSSPTHSPTFERRSRTVSMSNPEPVIRLVAEGLVRKAEDMKELLDDRLLASVLEDGRGIVDPPCDGTWCVWCTLIILKLII